MWALGGLVGCIWVRGLYMGVVVLPTVCFGFEDLGMEGLVF